MTSNVPTLPMNDGSTIPAVALGTYRLNGSAGVEAMISAIEQGYRLLDSAFNYENEGALGQAVARSSVPRDELRLTSKLPGRHHAYDDATRTVEESLFRAGLDYWDHYLIHWPNPNVDKYVEAFQALVDLQKRGLIRSVGVSNFLPDHLRRLKDEVGVVPAINQIELHPYFPQAKLVALHEQLGIVTEAWSPIGRGNEIVDEQVITQIAQAHGRSAVQVILRWHVQRGVVPLPKSANTQRQRENLEIFDFELTVDEVNAITGLGRPDGRLKGQDPATYEEM